MVRSFEEMRRAQTAAMEETARMTPSERLQMLASVGGMVRSQIGSCNDFDEFASRIINAGLVNQKAFHRMEDFREQLHSVHQAVMWAEYGFNVFNLSPDLAAGFVLTDPPPVPSDGLNLPFPSFCIRIPEGTVPMFQDGKQYWAEYLWVQQFTGRHFQLGKVPFFRYTAFYKSLTLWRDRFPGNLDDEEDQSFYNAVHLGDPPYQDEDKVALKTALRVIKNLVAWLESMGGVESQVRPQPPHLKRKASKEARQRVASGVYPHVWLFGQNVKLSKEARKMAAEVALGASKRHEIGGWKVRVKHVVRGHWKQQAFGEGRAERKRVWIQPYWRGPEGAAAWSHLYNVG